MISQDGLPTVLVFGVINLPKKSIPITLQCGTEVFKIGEEESSGIKLTLAILSLVSGEEHWIGVSLLSLFPAFVSPLSKIN